MVWDPTVPATNSPLLSAPIRDNFAALDALMSGGGSWGTYPLTTPGDLLVGGTAGAPGRLGVGTNGHVLTLAAGLPAWAAPAASWGTYPLTTPGDLLVGGTAGAPGRLGVGTTGHVLTLAAGLPTWAAPGGMVSPMLAYGDLITGVASGTPARLAVGPSGQVLTVLPATGAPALDGTALAVVNDTSPSTPTVISATTTATGTYMVVSVSTAAGGGPPTVASVTFGATTLTQLAMAVNAGNNTRLLVYSGVVPASTTANVTVTYTAGGGGFGQATVGVRVYRNVTGVGTPVTANLANVATVTTTLTGVTGAHCVDATTFSLSGLTITPGTGQVEETTFTGSPDPNLRTSGEDGETTFSWARPGGTGTWTFAIQIAVPLLAVPLPDRPAWAAPSFASPLTTIGDLIVGGTAGVPSRLAAVATGAVLASAGVGTAPTWSTTPTIGALTVSKLPDAQLFLAPPSGGHQYTIFAGGTGSSNPNQLIIYDNTLVKPLFANNNADWSMAMWDGAAHGMRGAIQTGAADSGGSGFRVLRVPN